MSVKLVEFDIARTSVRDENYLGLAFQQAEGTHAFKLSIEGINPINYYPIGWL